MLQLQTDQASASNRPRMGLVAARLSQRWTQQDVADRVGTTYVNVSRWERGVTCPAPYARARLVQLFGKTVEELNLTGTLSNRSLEELAWQQAPCTAGQQHPTIDPALPLPQPWRLYGREKLLVELKTQLRRGGHCTTYALEGLPGIGKTALAIELAYDPEVRELFPDGVLWARLGPEPYPMRTLSRWGALLGIAQVRKPGGLTGLEAWAMAIRSAIAQRAMLLVIDDAWSFSDALAFKVGGPNCCSLLTTRSPAVSALFANTHITQVGELGEQEGLTLLGSLAKEVVCWKREAARQLVQAVGGLPLAIILLGRYLHLTAMNHQRRRLRDALDRLSQIEERLCLAEPQAPLEHHSSLPAGTPLSLAAIIATSFRRLPEPAQATLSALAALPAKPHSFSEEEALAVANCQVETLDALYDAGLLQCVGQGRYTLHPTISDFGKYHQQRHATASMALAERQCGTEQLYSNKRAGLALMTTYEQPPSASFI